MTPAFTHLTVPTDGSTTAERGVAFAVELARDGGKVTFCSVVDPTLVCLPAAYGLSADPGPMLEILDEDAAVFCRRAQQQAERAGIASDVQVLHGQCVESVEELVRRNHTQAIVVGTHGRTGLSRNVLGSVAEALIRQSDVPVIAVHEDDAVRTGPIAVAIDASPAARAALEVALEIAAARGIPIALVHACPAAERDPVRINALMSDAVESGAAHGVRSRVVVREGPAGAVLLAAADELECCMIVMGTHGRPFIAKLVLGSVAAYVVEHARVPVVTVRRSSARR